MNKNLINKLPTEIKIKITSYLYYSYPKSKIIFIINKIINNYSYYFLKEIYNNKTISDINYYILKYYLYDKINYKKYNINFDININDNEKKAQIDNIFKSLTPIHIQRLYNYIMF
tara:strand:- start:2617 stop:2961 length:345 start_codon:yes stop_codon:yes gene_type:complete